MPDPSNFTVSTVKKEAVGLVETLVTIYKTKRCHKPGELSFKYYSRENLKYTWNIFNIIFMVHCESNYIQ
jgi:hypothetical protein